MKSSSTSKAERMLFTINALKASFIILNILLLFGCSFQQKQQFDSDAESNRPASLDEQKLKRSENQQLTKPNSKNDYIFLNTIDGILYAIGKYDGKIKWSIKEDAVLKFPKNHENPYFLTDPRDGSLYIFTNQREGLKKFPYTIAELVSASPSKTADGYLYTGDKKDQWLAIDYRNGLKLDTLTSETLSSKISTSDENILFIGRTQYTISMFDINTRKKLFNLTYYDYSTHAIKSKLASKNSNEHYKGEDVRWEANYYPFYHFTSSSDGTIITLDKNSGDLVWQLKLENPIVSMYRYEKEQLFKINFVIFAKEALTNLDPYKFSLLHNEQKFQEQQYQVNIPDKQSNSNKIQPKNLFITSLYIGFYENNLYALPALVYNWQKMEIEGPSIISNSNIKDSQNIDKQKSENNKTSNSIFIGHHKLPEKFNPPPNYIQPNDRLIVISTADGNENYASIKELFTGNQQPSCPAEGSKHSKFNKRIPLWKRFDQLMQNKYFFMFFTVLLCSMVPLLKILYDESKKRKRKLLQNHINNKLIGNYSDEDELIDSKNLILNDQSYARNSNSSNNSSKKRVRKFYADNLKSDSSSGDDGNKKDSKNINFHLSHSLPNIDNDGCVRIGKIVYDPKQVLGHGCAGTFVYKGKFEQRPVAVKRLLPECYTLADREVELLRDADQHQNVLRYFCTESDSQFRYIALELCQMTLNEYVNNQNNLIHNSKFPLRSLNILEQATKGLNYLHTLDIVHRDIKPHNVLISFPDQRGQVFAMISDFGLCKRLEYGNNSFSKRSGVIGTDGWIAPELLEDIFDNDRNLQGQNSIAANSKRVTKSVDIFSLGCVYYFVLSGGFHPFGDSLRRQANILTNQFKLEKLICSTFSELHMQRILIESMISNDPRKRPTSKQILAHPVYWSKSKTLQFLQDVSDRIEKLEQTDPIIIELEKNANVTLKNNWKTYICPQLQNDLKKFRQYNGVNVRDLLRAIRNKKHHYRELPSEVKKSLGSLPDEFVDYFTERFPKLIIHVYNAMKCCQNESMLDVYYQISDIYF